MLETLAALEMLEVVFPTTDGRRLVMPRYTQLAPEQKLLYTNYTSACRISHHPEFRPSPKYFLPACCICRPDLCGGFTENKNLTSCKSTELRKSG